NRTREKPVTNMSPDATTSSKEKMDCARVAREEILARYLLGRLSDEERDAFEEHYFECTHCFEELQTVRAIQEELRRTSTELRAERAHRFVRWQPAVAVAAAPLVLAVGVMFWMRGASPSRPLEGTTASSSPPAAEVSQTSKPQQAQPPIARRPVLEELARV